MSKDKKNKKRKSPNPNGIPVGLYGLGEEDSEFWHVDKNGRSPRVFIEDVRGDRFYFSNTTDGFGRVLHSAEDKAWAFVRIHGLNAVSDRELNRLRDAETPDAGSPEDETGKD